MRNDQYCAEQLIFLLEGRLILDQRSDLELNAALIGFGEESVSYCNGINDNLAREYAVEYTKMIEQRLRGLESQPPKVRHGLFAPSRRLICSTLEGMHDKYFPP